MKNDKEPIYEVCKYFEVDVNSSDIVIEIGPNEFSDFNDKVGLISQEVEPYEFGSIMDVKESKGTSMNISLIQSDKKKTYERTTWTFFSFIGDVGGFNGAIGIFPTFIMSYYSSHMYQASVFNDVPVTSKRKSKKRSISALEKKLA